MAPCSKNILSSSPFLLSSTKASIDSLCLCLRKPKIQPHSIRHPTRRRPRWATSALTASPPSTDTNTAASITHMSPNTSCSLSGADSSISSLSGCRNFSLLVSIFPLSDSPFRIVMARSGFDLALF